MVKCEICTYSNDEFIKRDVEYDYKKYEVLDVKFSTTMDEYESLLKYSVMIIYKEK